MQVEIAQAGKYRVPKQLITKLFDAAAQCLPRIQEANVSVAFVSSHAIRDMNRRYRNQDRVTDVLSFAEQDSAPMPSQSTGYLGEIIIAYPRARRQAREQDKPISEEIVFLLAHGLLHLLGHDHHQAAAARRMKRLEACIMEQLHKS